MRVSRWLLGLILLLAVIVPAQAQQAPPTSTATLTSATCPGTGCAVFGASGYGGIGVQLTGTFVATVQFEGIVANDTSGTFTAVTCTPWNSTTGVTSSTSTGLWGCPVGGLSLFRVRVSAYTSGSVVVTTLKAPTLARGSGGGGGGTISGTIADTQIAVGTGADTIGGSANLTWTTGDTFAVHAGNGYVSLSSSGDIFSQIESEALPNLEAYNFTYDGSTFMRTMDNGDFHVDLPNVASTFHVTGRILSLTAENSGLEAALDVRNLSNTADSAVIAALYTTGNNATGPSSLELRVHDEDTNQSSFLISLAGDSGNDTPTTTVTAPGDLAFIALTAFDFSINRAGDQASIFLYNTSDTAGANTTLRIGTTGDTADGAVEIGMRVHDDGANSAEFLISLAGNSGNNTPLTTVTSPGLLAFSTLTTTGAATGKKVVCVDTATGILYASSTGTDCSN